jgi:hypothetical protein
MTQALIDESKGSVNRGRPTLTLGTRPVVNLPFLAGGTGSPAPSRNVSAADAGVV